MTDRYDVFYESPDGDTSNATQPFLPLEWSEASLTFRRRAPHSGTITIPGSSHHVPSDFKAGREIIIKRNGQHWFAGIMDMPSISGERGKRGMQLPMWGQAKVLDFYRNSVTDTLLTDAQDGLTTTTLVNGYLALAVHGVFGTDAAWFPSAGRSLSLKSTIIPHWVMSGKSILQVVTELCDYDGLSWYVGVDSSGGWTFTTSSAAPSVDQHGVVLIDGTNCVISSVDQDGSQIVSSVTVAARRRTLNTTVTVGYSAGVTTVTLDDTTDVGEGDHIVLGVGAASLEEVVVDAVSGSSVTFTTATLNAHANGETVGRPETEGAFRTFTRTASAATAVNHLQSIAIFDDSMRYEAQANGRADAYLAAYGDGLQTAHVTITDRALLDLLAWQPLLGNRLQLISNDRLLADLFGGTGAALTVQDYTLTLRGDGAARMDLTLGDPALDNLAVLERKTAAGHTAATMTTRE